MVHAEYMVVKAGDSRQRAAAYVLIAAALAMLLFCACFSAIPTQEQIRESARQDFQRNLSQAEAGNAAAQRWLWLTYKRGNSVVERNPVEALRWLRSAAALGESTSRLELANDYRMGELGLPRDFAEALRRLQEMCVPATLNDHETAVARACVELGEIYLLGKEAPRDVASTLAYYETAATHQRPDAASRLAKLYLEGTAVPQNLVEACKWSILAGAPQDKLTALEARMPAADVQRARDAAAAWIAVNGYARERR